MTQLLGAFTQTAEALAARKTQRLGAFSQTASAGAQSQIGATAQQMLEAWTSRAYGKCEMPYRTRKAGGSYGQRRRIRR